MKLIPFLVVLSGCVVVDPATLSKRCDAARACATGEGCFCGQCTPCDGGACQACALNGAGLSWWWPLDTGPDGVANDCAGNKRPGLASVEGVSVVPGAFGSAWALTPGVELVASEPALNLPGRTLSMHVKLTDSAAQTLWEERSATSQLRLVGELQGTTSVFTLVSNGRTLGTASSSGAFAFVAVTRGVQDDITLFGDGTPVTAGTMAFEATSAALHPSSTIQPATRATFDEVRAYGRVLTVSEVTSLRSGGCASAPSP